MKGEDLSDRFLDFAARTIALVGALPKNPVGKILRKELRTLLR